MPPRDTRPEIITSRDNSHVKWLRSLRERRGRDSSDAFLVEGPRAVEQALASGAEPIAIAWCEDFLSSSDRVEALVRRAPGGTRTLEMGPRAFSSIADTVHTQGVVAAFPRFHWHLGALSPLGSLALVLDRVSDPGNVGTLLRSAAAVGADAVLLSRGSADPYNPKVVRASAGAIFAVRFAVLDWEEIAAAVGDLPGRYAAVAGAERAYYEADLTTGCAILIGNEAAGLSAEALALATEPLRIPMRSGVESLNAGVAGSLFLFEAQRQRSQKSLDGA